MYKRNKFIDSSSPDAIIIVLSYFPTHERKLAQT